MKIIFQVFCGESAPSSDYNAERPHQPTPISPRLQARHFDRSGPQSDRGPRSGEIRFSTHTFHPATTASLPLHLSGLIATPRPPKIYFKKEENFRRRKKCPQTPRSTTQ